VHWSWGWRWPGHGHQRRQGGAEHRAPWEHGHGDGRGARLAGLCSLLDFPMLLFPDEPKIVSRMFSIIDSHPTPPQGPWPSLIWDLMRPVVFSNHRKWDLGVFCLVREMK
jgi:hypothetical protein